MVVIVVLPVSLLLVDTAVLDLMMVTANRHPGHSDAGACRLSVCTCAVFAPQQPTFASVEVRAALKRLADRYATMARGCNNSVRVALSREYAIRSTKVGRGNEARWALTGG
jgi:hypothetical protein